MASSMTNSAKRCIDGASALATNDGAADGKKSRIDDSGASAPAMSTITNGFAMADFIAPAVAQYLGVRSLVRFGSTCSSHAEVMNNEVARRKKCIADIEAKVKELMQSHLENAVPTRKNVIAAKKLVEDAKILVDDELDFHHKIGTKELYLDEDYWDEDGYYWMDHDFFLKERKKFLATHGGPLYILPDCFYFPPDRESKCFSEDKIADASRKANWLWIAEDHMQTVYECNMDAKNWDRLDYELPFWKFHLNGASFFKYECMENTAYELARGDATIDIDDFRIAARKVIRKAPFSRDCLWYTLEKADGIASRLR